MLPRHSNLLEFKVCGEAAGCVFDSSPDEGGSKPAVTEVRGYNRGRQLVVKDAY